ncbi:helix-turn-helix domain-containing protein [uncultured Thiohalocapsa sp.]|uniref:helix-turn-helix domain-containing protein n=1 Tax=uncultured Thiohalocapsa sp. TaxID=768990 RepID=UPI0025F4852B|nr:helix-turn-helix domain-containing protein [uncultured Thiohalocapsa sp.]
MTNPQMQLAREFVCATNRSVFLTGKAGTGKTTFLHNLKGDLPKHMIVTAPTGVAAINAGGVTLHSFFQLPFGPYVPGGEAERQAAAHRLKREKRDIIRSLDLLVIDEISMVRCDLLDAVDFVLRRHRGSDLPFGGVQLLMIGDLHQLAPVVPDKDWAILRDVYDSGYFFSSRALAASDVVPIALQHVYRQSDADFIALLNRVRDNQLDDAAIAQLNSRHVPGFSPDASEGWITLTTHNRSAERINEARLDALDAKPFRFTAKLDGDYPAHSYPTAETLTLKVGAQVMFVRNDSSADKRWFNGKIGTVTQLSRERIVVHCPATASEPEAELDVEPVTWENIQYSIDQDTKEISEEVIGTFTQYPLRLAWAITIHKSQGLTFERAIIDAGAAFSHGQVYVALSRCKTFEGMVLSSPIPRHVIKTDRAVSQYVGAATRNPPTRQQLDAARIAYQQRLLRECWDFDDIGNRLRRLIGTLRSNHKVLDLHGGDGMEDLERHTLAAVVEVGRKFRRELESLFRQDQVPEEDAHLQARVRKASAYFGRELQQGLGPWLDAFSFDTDNKTLRKTLNDALTELRKALAVKTAGIERCREGFATNAYLNALAKARIDLEARPRRGSPGNRAQAQDNAADDAAHNAGGTGVLAALQQWRKAKADEEEREGIARCRILTRAVLRQIADQLPDSPEALAAISGIGKHSVQRYGQDILDIVAEHQAAAGARQQRRAKAQEPAEDTKHVSYRLHRDGLSIQQIAEQRALKPTTIEGHLAHFIGTGELAVTDFIDAGKLARITAALKENGTDTFGAAKAALGDDCSYGELKMVRAHLARKA